MLNSFLNSVIQLFKESGNYDVSESEDNGQAVTGSEASSCDDEIISEMSSKDLMKANDTSLSDDVETACNAMAKLEIQISGSQNDTVHAKRVTGDESNATQMITNFGSRSPTPLNGEYRTHVNIGVQTIFEVALEPAKQKCGDVSAKQKEENVSAKQNGDVSAKQKGEDASVQPKGGGTLRLRDWDSILISERLERCLSSPNVLRSISIQDKSMKISRKRREKKLHIQYRRPMLFSKKLEKCRSLPNLFRTSSIQDKSMKIARKRRERKHARQRWIRSNSLSSESEKESKKINMNAVADERKTELESESALTDSNGYNRDPIVSGSDVSFNSLVGELSDDVFDDYYTYNVDDAVKANSKNYKTANLRRISTIQKRSWLIRQRRRSTLNKFRSMET